MGNTCESSTEQAIVAAVEQDLCNILASSYTYTGISETDLRMLARTCTSIREAMYLHYPRDALYTFMDDTTPAQILELPISVTVDMAWMYENLDKSNSTIADILRLLAANFEYIDQGIVSLRKADYFFDEYMVKILEAVLLGGYTLSENYRENLLWSPVMVGQLPTKLLQNQDVAKMFPGGLHDEIYHLCRTYTDRGDAAELAPAMWRYMDIFYKAEWDTYMSGVSPYRYRGSEIDQYHFKSRYMVDFIAEVCTSNPYGLTLDQAKRIIGVLIQDDVMLASCGIKVQSSNPGWLEELREMAVENNYWYWPGRTDQFEFARLRCHNRWLPGSLCCH